MKDGAARARRIKAFYAKLKKRVRNVTPREPGPIIEELLFAILARETTDERAARALQSLRRNMVDLNELRVTTPREITSYIGEDFPNVNAKSIEIREVLADIVKRQNRLDLSTLKSKGLREAREYLETLRGVSPFAAAWVLARCLGGHAIAVDENMARVLKEEELVAPSADLAEIRAFLERHISAAEGRRFQMLLRQYALSRKDSRRRTSRAKPRSRRRAKGARPAARTSRRPARARAKARPSTRSRTKKKTAAAKRARGRRG